MGAQKETVEEREDAVKRGKATASVIGTKAMGTRFNVLMTIQVPLQQKKEPDYGSDYSDEDCDDCEDMEEDGGFRTCRKSSPAERTRVGTANAARVSRGSEFDVWPGLS